MKFSERIGITKPKEIQIDGMDVDLRNRLWNVYNRFISRHYYSSYFADKIADDYFKLQLDSDYDLDSVFAKVFFRDEWYKVFDLVEYMVNHINVEYLQNAPEMPTFTLQLNNVLEAEVSGYRFINGQFSPITNQSEMKEIEDALYLSTSFTALKGCNNHLSDALAKLSDRENPDYRNSIKESISAVESVAKIISGNHRDTLGQALDKIKGKLKIHASLERGFKSIYGYTSDEGGIRHSMSDDPNCDFEDAKFMLVACSAFVNYLVGKAIKAGIDLSTVPETKNSSI